MTAFPAANAISGASTVADLKAAHEAHLAACKQLLGGAARTTLTIASGAVLPVSAVHLVDTEGAAAADDLANITQTNLPDGSLLILASVDAGRVVTLKHAAGGAGQLSLIGSADLALASPADGVLLERSGTSWVMLCKLGAWSSSLIDGLAASAARTALGLAIGTNVQAYAAVLSTLAGLTNAAGKGIRFTGSGNAETFDLSDFAKTILDDVDAAAVKTTLGITAGGAWERVGNAVAINNVASVDWTGLDGDTYEYMLIFDNVVPVTVAGVLKLLTGYGGTPTYITSGYAQGVVLSTNAPANSAAGGTFTGLYIHTDARRVSGDAFISSASGSTITTAKWHTGDSGGGCVIGGGGVNTTATMTALRLIMSAGNLSTGTVSLYRQVI